MRSKFRVVLFTIGAIAFLNVLVLLHEIGHMMAMRATGLQVEELAVGMYVPGVPGIEIYTDSSGTRYSFYPVPLGGYARAASEERVAALTYWQKAQVRSAGIWVNLFVFAVIAAIRIAVTRPTGKVERVIFWGALSIITLVGAAPAATCAFVTPMLMFAVTGYLVYVVVRHAISDGAFPILGPIGAARFVRHRTVVSQEHQGVSHQETPFGAARRYLEAISLAIALVNIIPVMPLDGGWLMVHLLDAAGLPEVATAWKYGTTCALPLIVGYICYSDITRRDISHDNEPA